MQQANIVEILNIPSYLISNYNLCRGSMKSVPKSCWHYSLTISQEICINERAFCNTILLRMPRLIKDNLARMLNAHYVM